MVKYAVAFVALSLAVAQGTLIPIPTFSIPTITIPTFTIKPPTTTTTPTGGGKGDPIMSGLDGRSFEFFGKAGKVYNVLSEKTHQVSMKLKEGKMWDHEGTYMEALGFKYGEHTVEITNVGEGLTVAVDGQDLSMLPAQTEQEIILGLAQGEMSLLWQLHRADFGNSVEITTDLMSFVAWLTPAGSRDEGGVSQPAYLNFDLTLLATPAHNTMAGIVGETYASATSNAVAAENDFLFHGVEAEYEMTSLFQTGHAKCIFGKASAGKARKLIEGESITFPLKATSRGFSTILKASSRGLVGRKALN